MTVMVEVSNATVKRRVLTLASKMSSIQINDKINSLLDARMQSQREGVLCSDMDDELACWAEIWLRRYKPLEETH